LNLRDRDETKTGIEGLLKNKIYRLYPSFYINMKTTLRRKR
jgi:hypothetical protein